MFYLLHFWCPTFHSMKSAQHCTILVKVDLLNTYGVILSYFGITFLIFFMKMENIIYTSFQNSMPLFINGLIFDIMNIQSNQSFEFEWIPILAPLRSVNDWRFHGFVIFFLQLSKIDWILFSNAKETFTKDAGQKMFILWMAKHMKDWK